MPTYSPARALQPLLFATLLSLYAPKHTFALGDTTTSISDTQNPLPAITRSKHTAFAYARTLLTQSVDVTNSVDANGNTSLHKVLRYPSKALRDSLCAWVTRKGADPNAVAWNNGTQVTPLDLACKASSSGCVHTLLRFGAHKQCVPCGEHKTDTTAKIQNLATVISPALAEAVYNPHTVQPSQIAHLTPYDAATLLANYIFRGYLEQAHCICATFVRSGPFQAHASPSIQGNNHPIALKVPHFARQPLSQAQEDDTRSKQAQLRRAAARGNQAHVFQLANQGVDINAQDCKCRTALHHAATLGYEGVVAALLHHKANPDSTAHGNVTPLHAAAGKGHMKVAQQLLAAGATPDIPDVEGLTPLAYALRANSDNWQDIAALLEGASKKAEAKRTIYVTHPARYPEAKNLLFDAVKNRQEGHLKQLLHSKTKVNVYDACGRTPLHLASFNGCASICQTLLKNGASPHMVDANGATPLAYAIEGNHPEIARMLLYYEAPLNTKDQISGATPLYTAVRAGLHAISVHLINSGADVNATTNDDPPQTPFVAGLDYLPTSLIKLFISCGAYLPPHLCEKPYRDTYLQKMGQRVGSQLAYYMCYPNHITDAAVRELSHHDTALLSSNYGRRGLSKCNAFLRKSSPYNEVELRKCMSDLSLDITLLLQQQLALELQSQSTRLVTDHRKSKHVPKSNRYHPYGHTSTSDST